ncbi:MAG: ABC transporter substrate-binding (seleno)protein SaoB [Pseudomonadota bacterium]
MDRRITWCVLAGVAIVLTIFATVPASNQSDGEIRRIGIPDGSAGLLARYVLQEKLGSPAVQTVRFEPYTVYDCCASTTQYALGSAHLDLAIMCPDAARALVAKDTRFEIIGPVMINSDVLITLPNVDLQQPTIGISEKRAFQRKMVAERFGESGRAAPMMHTAVPFAYARGVIQGAILDITKVLHLDGDLEVAAARKQRICTYVLVSKKALKNKEQYTLFLEKYGQAVEEMDDPHNLLRLLRTYESPNISMGDVLKWQKMNVHFINPLHSPHRNLTWCN